MKQTKQSKNTLINCITNTIFRCKNSKINRRDYTFISYDRINNQDTQNQTNICNESGPRAMSTMIQEKSNMPVEYQLFPSKSDLHFTFANSDVSIYLSEEQFRDQFQTTSESTICADPELTRRQSVFSMTKRVSVEIPCNNLISPISFKTLSPSNTLESVEYLQSTEIFQVHAKTLTPNTTSGSDFSFPFLQSSSLCDKSSEEIDLKIKYIDSILSNLSTCDASSTINPTHIIISDYEATFVGDITVNLSDTVCILKNDNQEWVQVQVAKNGLTGFVPKAAVLEIKEFVVQLKVHRESLVDANSFLLSNPINV